jgi:hypothetical protein
MANTEAIIEVDIGVTPEAAVSGAVLLQSEVSAYLLFNAMRNTSKPSPSGGYYKEDAGIAAVQLVLCSITKFGYPNDEAWSQIPRTRNLGYGVFEVQNSAWKAELLRLNKYAFPDTKESNRRHFLFLFHDSSFECIAQELKVQVMPRPFHEVFSGVASRVFAHDT